VKSFLLMCWNISVLCFLACFWLSIFFPPINDLGVLIQIAQNGHVYLLNEHDRYIHDVKCPVCNAKEKWLLNSR